MAAPAGRGEPSDEAAPDALAIVKRSPEVVREGDKEAWLALFTGDAVVEDPVGAGAHVGRDALSKFWDVFIAPQRSITFEPRREFVRADHVIRYVTISTVTPVSSEPFSLSALIEYRVREGRIASLRAFWEPVNAVRWHAKQGARGLSGLLRHSLRTTRGLGLGAAMGFGLAMRPKVSRAEARRLAESLGRAYGGARDEWRALTEHARVAVADDAGGLETDAEAAWETGLEGGPGPRPVEVIAAGDWVATVLEGGERAVAALMRVDAGRVRELDVLLEAR